MSLFSKHIRTVQQTLSRGICRPEDIKLKDYDAIYIELCSERGIPIIDCVIREYMDSLHLGRLFVTDLPQQSLKGLGIGKTMLRNLRDLAQEVDHHAITLETTKEGAFVWPYHGFKATEQVWPSVREDLVKDLDQPSRYYDAYTGDFMTPRDARALLEIIRNKKLGGTAIIPVAQSPFGISLLQGREYDMVLNLESPYQMEVFEQATELTPRQKTFLQQTLNTVMGR